MKKKKNALFFDSANGANDVTGVASHTEHTHSWKLMEGTGAVTAGGHFIECECGLKYVLDEHNTTCSTCGYDSSTWYTVTVKSGADSAWATTEATFALPKETYLNKLATSGTWTCFNGKKLTYTAVAYDDLKAGDQSGKIVPDSNSVTIKLTTE